MSTISTSQTPRITSETTTRLATTLQGKILKVELQDGTFCIVKMADANLVKAKRSRRNTPVMEDFPNECELLMYLSQFADKPEAILHATNSWTMEDSRGHAVAHCLMTEFVNGRELFIIGKEFWVKHRSDPSSVNWDVWKRQTRSIFQQLVHAMKWMQSKGVVHLDLTPENVLVEEVIDPDTRESSVKIRIIDFGVARRCRRGRFMLTDRRGKYGYMSPEVYNATDGREYDGRAADIWSAGAILLFLLSSVVFPLPSMEEDRFRYAMTKGLHPLLTHWKLHLMSEDACDLLEKIFTTEENRISMEELASHPYVAESKVESEELDVDRWDGGTFQTQQLVDEDFCTNEDFGYDNTLGKPAMNSEAPLTREFSELRP